MNRNYTKQNPNFLIQSNESTLKFIRFNLSFLTTCGLVVCARYDLAYASCIFKNQDPSFSKTKWQPPLLRQSGSLSLLFRKKKKKIFAWPLLSRLSTILHLHTKLECNFWHCFLLLVICCPFPLCFKVPPM